MRIDGPQVTSSLSLNGTTITDLNMFVTTASFNGLTGSYATTGSNLFIGTQTLSGSILPSVNNTYDLGSPTQQFRHVYISSGSLYVNGTKVLGSTAQELQITTDGGQSFKILESGSDTITLQSVDGNVTLTSSGQGDIVLDPTTGIIGLKGTVTVYTGNKITSSDGNSIQFGNGIAVTGSIVSTVTPLVSGSSQVLNGSGVWSGSAQLPSGVVSGSSQILNGSGIWSGSAQLPSGIISGSSQLPGGIVSSSLQVTGYGFATTGSNTFVGSQVITGSLYITNDMIVQGCSCLQNITASAVSIGTNTVMLNTATPAVRFAGISVQDSGSNAGVTGSIFWDGLCNKWIYSNPSGIGYSGGMLISGPRNTGTIGNEVGLNCNYLATSIGSDHISSSMIYHDGTITCFPNTKMVITSGGNVLLNNTFGGAQMVIADDVKTNNGTPLILSSTDTSNQTQLVFGRVINCYFSIQSVEQNVGYRNLILQTNGGNVGIATTTPSAKLDVYAGADATSNLVLWGQTIRNEGNGATTGYGAGLKLKISTDNVTNEVYKWAGIAAVAGTNYSNRTDLALYSNAASTADATEKVRITGDGNVGIGVIPSVWRSSERALQIGTTTSLYDVFGITLLGNNFYTNTSAQSIYLTCGYASYYWQNSSDGSHSWNTALSGTTGNVISFTERMRINSSGNIGINTCTPSNLLHIEASNNTTNQFRVNSCDGLNAGVRSYTVCDGAGLIINHYYAVSGNPYLRTSDFVSNQGDAAATQMRFFTKAPSVNASLAMIITCGGTVGIGTATPKTYSSLTTQGQLISLNNIGIDYGQSFRLNNYYNSGTGTDRTISNGYAASIGLDQSGGAMVFYMSTTCTSADNNITTKERIRLTCNGTVLINNSGGYVDYSRVTISGTCNKNQIPGVGGSILHLTSCETDYPFGIKFNIVGDTCNCLRSVQIQTGDHGLTNQGNVTFQHAGGGILMGTSTSSGVGILNTYKAPINSNYVDQIVVQGTGNYPSLRLGTYDAYDGVIATTGNDLRILSGLNVTTENHNIMFYTSFNGGTTGAQNYERMRVRYDGNVGIGTASPYAKLTVAGTIGNPSTVGGDVFTIDTMNGYQTIANGGYVDFTGMSGFLMVNNWSNGATTLFAMGGGNTAVVGTVTGTAGTTHHSPGVGGYRWCNNYGSTANFGFQVFRTRNTA